MRGVRFMESEHLQNFDVSWGHEPVGIPLNRPPGTFSPTGVEGRDEGARFMESEHLQSFDVSWGHEPRMRNLFVCKQGIVRFMEREHLQSFDVSWGHEPDGMPLHRPAGSFP